MKNFGKLCIATVVAGMAGGVMAQEQIIKIGHIGPTSGPQAHFGKDDENGVRMAIEDLNAKGMEIAGKKVKFQIVAEDDAADPKQGTAAAQKLCDDKVAGAVTFVNSGVAIPASKVFHDCGIPMVTGAATDAIKVVIREGLTVVFEEIHGGGKGPRAMAVQAAGAQGDKRGVACSHGASASTHCFCSLEAAAPSLP